MKEFSVGVMAYNEADNISNLIKAITNQCLTDWMLREIVVISSGSYDGTDEKIYLLSKHDRRIKLIKQDKRYGKCSAIDIFLKNSSSEIVILVNGDSIPADNSFKYLLASLEERVGLTGSRMVPVNSGSNFMGFCIGFLWEMHHHVSMMKPKVGEMFVLRKVITQSMPEKSAVDEATLEAITKRRNYLVRYEPRAVVYIKGATDIKEFISQRRRIAYGHIWVYKNFNYLVSTREKLKTIKALVEIIRFNPQFLSFTFGCIFVEILSRFLGFWDYYVKRNNSHYIWKVAKSSKGIINVS